MKSSFYLRLLQKQLRNGETSLVAKNLPSSAGDRVQS